MQNTCNNLNSCVFIYKCTHICVDSSLHGGLKWGLLRSVGKEEVGKKEGGYFINVPH